MKKLLIEQKNQKAITIIGLLNDAYIYTDGIGKRKLNAFIEDINHEVLTTAQKGYLQTEIILKFHAFNNKHLQTMSDYTNNDDIITVQLDADFIHKDFRICLSELNFDSDGNRQYLKGFNDFQTIYRSIFDPQYEEKRISKNELFQHGYDGKAMEREKRQREENNKVAHKEFEFQNLIYFGIMCFVIFQFVKSCQH